MTAERGSQEGVKVINFRTGIQSKEKITETKMLSFLAGFFFEDLRDKVKKQTFLHVSTQKDVRQPTVEKVWWGTAVCRITVPQASTGER